MATQIHPTVRQVDRIAESLQRLEMVLYHFGICRNDKPMNVYSFVIKYNHLLRLDAVTDKRSYITS